MNSEHLFLQGQESYDEEFRILPLPDGFGGLKRLKYLRIWHSETEECLANAPATTVVFPVLEKLNFFGLPNIREICRGPVPEGSFGKLTSIEIRHCNRLKNLFPLQIVGCLTQLQRLTIQSCARMKEVIWKEQRDAHIATNGIEFRNLEFLNLDDLPSLRGFCTAIDQIDFPKLRCLHLSDFRQFKCLFDIKSILSSNSEQNFSVGSLSLFPQKVTFPCLEDLILRGLDNVGDQYYIEFLISSFLVVKKLEVSFYNRLRYVFHSSVAGHLVHLKELNISNCWKMEAVVEWEDEIEDGQERKADTTLFPQLGKLQLTDLPDLGRIFRGPVPGGSFGELTSIEIRNCNRLENLFPLQIVGCLTHLIHLTIESCAMMKEVVWKEQRDADIATNGIKFRNLEFLHLEDLPRLVDFCGGIDQIDFPKLKCMHLRNLREFKRLFDIKSSLSSNSEKNFDVGFPSFFPRKITFPCLEDLILQQWDSVGDKYYIELLISSFPPVKKLEVSFCDNLRYVFHSSVAGHLVHLKELNISYCSKMEAVFEREDEIEDGQERKVVTTLFPQLGTLRLNNLPNLRRFCHFNHTLELPMLSKLDIWRCPNMDALSVGHVSTPNLSLLGVSWNGNLNNALSLLQEKREKAERQRFVVVEEDLTKQRRVADDDIHDEDDLKKRRRVADDDIHDEDDLKKRRRVADDDPHEHSLGSDEGEPHSIQASEIYEPAPDIEHENVRDGDRHEHLEDSYKMEVDSYDYERNNNMITWRETLPPNPQRGRCICFRTADLYTDTSVITRFYSVPFDLFGDGGDDDASSSNRDVEGLEPFYKCTYFATTSTLSSVGSSLFVVGGSKEIGPCRVSITTEKMYRFDTTAPENDWYKYDELSMCTPRAFPITVTMDGKLYIFGGSGPESSDAPLAEMFNPESSKCEPLPRPPSFDIDGWRHLVVAALQPYKKILVASGLSDVVSVYNVVKGVWEELDHKVDFSSVRGQAAVVQNGNALCWCSNNVEEVHAYHLVHKRWFKSPIKGLDKVGMRDPDGMTHYCPIFPLDNNHLCLLWKDHMGYNGTNLPLLHCIKIQVSIDRGGSRFDAVVVAYRTYALGPHENIFDAHVFLQEDDEGREGGSGRSGHKSGGRTWERSGYGGGKRTVSSIAPFKACSKCWGTGHTESSCDQRVASLDLPPIW